MHWLEPIDARERGVDSELVRSAKRVTIASGIAAVVMIAPLALLGAITWEHALMMAASVLLAPLFPLYLSRWVNKPKEYTLDRDVLRLTEVGGVVSYKLKYVRGWSQPDEDRLLLYIHRPGHLDGLRREVIVRTVFLPADAAQRARVTDALVSQAPHLEDAEPWVRYSLAQDVPAKLAS